MYLPFPVIFISFSICELLFGIICFLSKGLPLVFFFSASFLVRNSLSIFFLPEKFYFIITFEIYFHYTQRSRLACNLFQHFEDTVLPLIISTEKLNVSFAITAPQKQHIFFLGHLKHFYFVFCFQLFFSDMSRCCFLCIFFFLEFIVLLEFVT